MMTMRVVFGALLVSVALAASTVGRAQGASNLVAPPIVVEPSLTCARGSARPELHLLVTNRSSNTIAAGKTIRVLYQLKPDNRSGEGRVQLAESLLSGQTIEVSLGDVQSGAFQGCSASLVTSLIGNGRVIKFPYVIAPRQP